MIKIYFLILNKILIELSLRIHKLYIKGLKN